MWHPVARYGDMVRLWVRAELSYPASFAMLVVGMLCLLADLGRPEAFYLLFLHPTGSFVSIGTFALTLFAACLTLALAESVLVLGPAWERAALAAKVPEAVSRIACGTSLMSYSSPMPTVCEFIRVSLYFSDTTITPR